MNIGKSTCTKYLGIHLDSKLNWRQHTEKIHRKACILKRLTGTKWGSPLETLNQTLKIYMKPLLTYGAEAMVTAKKNIINKLETLQNQLLRMITGAVKTTNTTTMKRDTHSTLQNEINKRACILRLKNTKHA